MHDSSALPPLGRLFYAKQSLCKELITRSALRPARTNRTIKAIHECIRSATSSSEASAPAKTRNCDNCVDNNNMGQAMSCNNSRSIHMIGLGQAGRRISVRVPRGTDVWWLAENLYPSFDLTAPEQPDWLLEVLVDPGRHSQLLERREAALVRPSTCFGFDGHQSEIFSWDRDRDGPAHDAGLAPFSRSRLRRQGTWGSHRLPEAGGEDQSSPSCTRCPVVTSDQQRQGGHQPLARRSTAARRFSDGRTDQSGNGGSVRSPGFGEGP